VRRRLTVLGLAVAAALVLAGAAVAANGGFTPPTARSPNADRINDTYYVILGITGAVFVIVEGALIVFVYRFRSRGRRRSVDGPQIHGSTRLEQAWTTLPVILLAVIVGIVFYLLPGIKDTPAATNRVDIGVTGHQFYWEFRYPDGQVSVDRLVTPAGQVVHLDIRSTDVAHSWWVPELGGKFDAIPGRTNRTWFKATRKGTYEGQCDEFCGLLHAQMLARVEVVDRGTYESFLAAHAPGSATVGKETVDGVCEKCHGSLLQGDIGPKLAGSGQIADRKSLATVIRNGTGRMPAVGKDWTDAQLNATIDYLQKEYGPKGGAASGG
jgi:cytochrome c oxidase subunit 2